MNLRNSNFLYKNLIRPFTLPYMSNTDFLDSELNNNHKSHEQYEMKYNPDKNNFLIP